jgi:flagellar basal-body rod modification protein FlgD
MTTVNSASGIQNLATGAGGAPLSKTSADFNMFLKMLTTQMQNQDPLDPMDTSEYTQQLVQYSQVEQTIQQTGTLKDILSRLSTQDMAQASAFIGREAQFDSNVAGLASGSPASWSYSTSRPVSSLVATITDASGKVVDTRPLDAASSGRFNWNGALAGGAKAPDGSYTLAIQGVDSSGGTVPVAISSVGTVKEVVTGDGTVNLRANGVNYAASKLLRVSATEQ